LEFGLWSSELELRQVRIEVLRDQRELVEEDQESDHDDESAGNDLDRVVVLADPSARGLVWVCTRFSLSRKRSRKAG
jgi:hypothetical protein